MTFGLLDTDWRVSWRLPEVCWITSNLSSAASKSWAVASALNEFTSKLMNRTLSNGRSLKLRSASRFLNLTHKGNIRLLNRIWPQNRNRNEHSSMPSSLKVTAKRNWKLSSTSARMPFLKCNTPMLWWLLTTKAPLHTRAKRRSRFLWTKRKSINLHDVY